MRSVIQKLSSKLSSKFSSTLSPPAAERPVKITVTERGFEPATVDVKAGEPVTLMILRKTERTCAREIVIDEAGIRESLPIGVPVRVAFTPERSGTIVYGCAMGKMVRGALNVLPAL